MEKDYNYYVNAISKLKPIKDNSSLHIISNEYLVEGDKIVTLDIGSDPCSLPEVITVNDKIELERPNLTEYIKIKPKFINAIKTKKYFEFLSNNIMWNEELTSLDNNEKVKINRKMAYVTDDIVEYKYAKLSFTGEKWNEILLEIKNKLEEETGFKFNSVLLNLYKDGKDEIKWHSDKEDSLGEKPVIACINLGATRKFWFRKRGSDNPKFYYIVNDGDLLIMGENCQRDYVHAILKESEVNESRVSLTFRYNY